MKKKFFAKVSAVLAMILAVCFTFAGCGGLFGGGSPAEYTIQYSDDEGTHTLTVTKGALYHLDSVPYMYGYEFMGLYDAETAGTQYVGANGAAVAPYPDNASKVLYPRFKPIDYTVILNYGEAAVTGARSLTVAYDAALPALPDDLTLAHSVFKGWYTEEGCGGTQVADVYGNIPAVAVLNNTNFTLDDTNRRAYLYAGFELEKYAVTFHFGGGLSDETLQIPYGTPIGSVVLTTRNAEKQAVLLWSTRANDTEKQDIFNGNITGTRELYAAEWAPVIELDGDGAEVAPIVARAGTAVALPTPTKPLAKFLRWETLSGQTASITEMPSTSTTLKAVWQAKIEFDENGGSGVNDISEPAGSSITLPTPEREGYIFAGWYTADKEQFTSSKMPSAGIALKAGWYKTKTVTEVVVSADKTEGRGGDEAFMDSLTLDFSKYLSSDFAGYIEVKVMWYEKNEALSTNGTVMLRFFSKRVISDEYRLGGAVTNHTSNDYSRVERKMSTRLEGNKIYVTFGSSYSNFGWTHGLVTDFRYQLTYPDTTYLYL